MRPLFVDCPPFLEQLYREEGLDRLVPDLEVHVGDPAGEELVRLCAGRTHILDDHSRFTAEILERCPSLRCIVFLGTGAASFIDLDAAARLGIEVRSYKGYGDRSVAEHAFALMLAAAHRIAEMDRDIRAGLFQPKNSIELLGKTVGVIGTGGIGREMVRLCAAIGMKVLAWNRSGVPSDLPCEAVSLEELLHRSDVVSLHLVLNEETRGFLGRDKLALLKPGAIFVNTARGAIVDEAALVEALESGRIAHAALDVFVEEPLPADHPFRRLPNVTMTPHAAFMTREASRNLLRMALEILREELGRS
ncbi:MAG: NAD(P)-binding domain-containing protein [Geminicoccaceae bacterium]|nr:NAD(P)-binding domain-containing protein [Geminicoccaceae bacterium]MCS7268733.1 NAD(P)-binding domain-containing protein [Geminicoccaceae bacterium]MCX7629099.1 NAD(P)-binding domain-containing protein [Geminicoccaceae bacterium]MDW8125809.1 NAD(P)-dependent oxidoreductase [Geminicoccaceae bacterium]